MKAWRLGQCAIRLLVPQPGSKQECWKRQNRNSRGRGDKLQNSKESHSESTRKTGDFLAKRQIPCAPFFYRKPPLISNQHMTVVA